MSRSRTPTPREEAPTRRPWRAVCLLAAPLLVGSACASGGAAPGPGRCAVATAAVRAVERAWLDAYQTRDAARMSPLLSEDFMITQPNGTVRSKAQVLAGLERNRGRPAPVFATEDVLARCYGDAVVLTGWVTDTRDGRTTRSRYTDTYARREGRWMVVASHLSPPQTP